MFHRSLIVWGGWIGLFLALELPAAFGLVPWLTLSSTSWDAESAWTPARVIFAAFLAVLLAHIVFRLSAAALVSVVVVAAVALLVHLFA